MSEASVEHRPIRMRHVLLTAGLLLCILIVLCWRPLTIRFHQLGMQWANSELEAALSGRSRGLLLRHLDQRSLWDWYAFHRDGLVRQKLLVHRQYRFGHVSCPSPEAGWVEQQFFSRLRARPRMYGSTSGKSRASTDYEVNIWIHPDDVADWDAWHASLNRPGVAEAGVAAEAAQAEDSLTTSSSD